MQSARDELLSVLMAGFREEGAESEQNAAGLPCFIGRHLAQFEQSLKWAIFSMRTMW